MQDRFVQALEQLPELFSESIKPLLGQAFSGHITKIQLADLCQQTRMDENALLLALLPIAAALASPPISEFYVGAIAKGGSGDIYMGANLELSGEALCHSVHAEQSAISHAWLAGETCITDIIVNASPCGHCRQFINELVNGSEIKIHLPTQQSQSLAYYLPYAFGPSDLNITLPLLTKQDTQLKLTTEDPLFFEALNQASQSYAPYSGNHSAVVIAMTTGEVFVGRYAENAAFNPSMLPLQMALSGLLRHNHRTQDISRVVLVESSSGKISLLNATRDALKAICEVQLEHALAIPA